MAAVEYEAGDSAYSKQRKEVTWSKGDIRNLDFELMSPASNFVAPCIPVGS